MTAERPRRLSREERRAETRRSLLDAAAAVFIRRGLGGASVEEISAEAGFTRGAFYSNFESKEEMFVELLQERVYSSYRDLVQRVPQDAPPAEQLRWMADDLKDRYGREEDAWLFALWLELLAHAARNPEFRSLAATFWRDTRAVGAAQIERTFEASGTQPPTEPRDLAIAMTALDIGLAVQNLVDPDEVPLDLYPRLFEALFGRLIDGRP
jgi:AcrR family transcriptional regulator